MNVSAVLTYAGYTPGAFWAVEFRPAHSRPARKNKQAPEVPHVCVFDNHRNYRFLRPGQVRDARILPEPAQYRFQLYIKVSHMNNNRRANYRNNSSKKGLHKQHYMNYTFRYLRCHSWRNVAMDPDAPPTCRGLDKSGAYGLFSHRKQDADICEEQSHLQVDLGWSIVTQPKE